MSPMSDTKSPMHPIRRLFSRRRNMRGPMLFSIQMKPMVAGTGGNRHVQAPDEAQDSYVRPWGPKAAGKRRSKSHAVRI